MPVKNYYTLNGEIIGERTVGGARTDYLTDALGSVTATVDQNAQVVNTYRYKPYGAQLARTGAGPDPRFRWAGGWGWRATALPVPSHYIRLSHYSNATSAWISRKGYAWNDSTSPFSILLPLQQGRKQSPFVYRQDPTLRYGPPKSICDEIQKKYGGWISREECEICIRQGYTLVWGRFGQEDNWDVSVERIGPSERWSGQRFEDCILRTVRGYLPIEGESVFASFMKFGYGNCCGFNKKCSGVPGRGIDCIDEACNRHDKCIGGWVDAVLGGVERIFDCNVELCWDAIRCLLVGCDKAPNPRTCREAAYLVGRLFCTVSGLDYEFCDAINRKFGDKGPPVAKY